MNFLWVLVVQNVQLWGNISSVKTFYQHLVCTYHFNRCPVYHGFHQGSSIAVYFYQHHDVLTALAQFCWEWPGLVGAGAGLCLPGCSCTWKLCTLLLLTKECEWSWLFHHQCHCCRGLVPSLLIRGRSLSCLRIPWRFLLTLGSVWRLLLLSGLAMAWTAYSWLLSSMSAWWGNLPPHDISWQVQVVYSTCMDCICWWWPVPEGLFGGQLHRAVFVLLFLMSLMRGMHHSFVGGRAPPSLEDSF